MEPQHLTYDAKEIVLFHRIQSQTGTTFSPKYDGVEEMTSTLQNLHMSNLLTHDDEGVDKNEPNDFEYTHNGTYGHF